MTHPLTRIFWNWLVKRFPLWVAPNLITLFGLVINVVTSLLLLYHSPTAREEAPAWAYLAFAIGIFVYQTLDAIDGKQARRTGSGTPLGSLFDHGCDAITKALTRSDQKKDERENEEEERSREEASEDDATEYSRSDPSPGLAFLFPVTLAFVAYKMSSVSLYQTHPCLFLSMVGITVAKITIKLIIAQMTKSNMTILDSSLIGPGLLLLDQCLNSFINEYILLWLSLVYVTLDLATYSSVLCMQICDHLDIYCFSITSKPSLNGLKLRKL
ncbi:cholinephosphotransferase 1-like [Branchiostoma floridae]|uniref:Cholinephosphotransferase 1-like n=1 Tax=Branchiostoma floridae TaxID=7739 RepID=A0A9J7MF39_BRAFL|nr:cholinephosphotransferase 1-like [Branchiostoma floridae]